MLGDFDAPRCFNKLARHTSGFSFYAYCNADPVDCIDATGKMPAWVIPVAVAVAFGVLLPSDQPHSTSAGQGVVAALAAGLITSFPTIGAIAAIAIGAVMGVREVFLDPVEMAKQTNLPGRRDGPQDAFCHCLASCIAARNYGSGASAFMGSTFEDLNPDPSQRECDMDLANNASGIAAAASSPVNASMDPATICASTCMSALEGGRLQTSP